MALDALKERPWTGYGIGQVIYETSYAQLTEIHNLWLKWAVSCGVVAPLLFLAMVTRILLSVAQNLRRAAHMGDAVNTAAPGLIVILGAILSLAEPNVLLGSFQISAVWWAAAGTVMTMSLKRRIQSGGGKAWPLQAPTERIVPHDNKGESDQ